MKVNLEYSESFGIIRQIIKDVEAKQTAKLSKLPSLQSFHGNFIPWLIWYPDPQRAIEIQLERGLSVEAKLF